MRVRLLVSLLVGTLLLSGCGFGPREPGDVITGWYAAKTLQDGLGFFTDDAQIVDGGITYAGLANPTPRGVDCANKTQPGSGTGCDRRCPTNWTPRTCFNPPGSGAGCDPAWLR